MQDITTKDINSFIEQMKLKPVNYFKEKDWLEKFNKCHQPLYQFLNNSIITTVVPQCRFLDDDAPNPVVGQVANRIYKIIPGYLSHYNLKDRVFARENITTQNNISLAKHLLGYAQRIKLGPHKLHQLCMEIAELGKIHKDLKKGISCEKIMISLDPRSFINIGFEGCHDISCWKTNGFSYKFSLFPNTFCWYILDPNKKYSEKEIIVNQKYLGRGLGSFDPKQNLLKIHNGKGYRDTAKNTITQSFMTVVWEDILKQLFIKNKEFKIKENSPLKDSSGRMYFDRPSLIIKDKDITNQDYVYEPCQ